MANPEHLAILKQGVDDWNKWREANPSIRPDLSGADFHFADLKRVNLFGTDLREANLEFVNLWNGNLSTADLGRAILARAKLSETNMMGASLWEADLKRTNLECADLSYANLQKAILDNASLRATNLQHADLRNATLLFTDLTKSNLSLSKFGFTIFVYADLSTARGLDQARHYGSSSIDIDTLFRSHGNIPEPFLRGCGVPDQMIEYAKSLTNTPIHYYSCFISYSHKDEEFAQRIYADLQVNNVRCWYAPHDLKIGDKIRPTIDESIRIHDKLLLILSEHSVKSDWVEHEAEHALDLETERNKVVLFPVRLDESVMDSKNGWASNVRRQRHIGDFTKWKNHDAYKEAFDRLLRDLKA